MVSNIKRMRYVSENFTSSDEDSFDDVDYLCKKENGFNPSERQRRKPRCLSKNALMARENRLKKKMYVNKLENEIASYKNDNKKLTTVVRNQSLLVEDLKKEVKYLKSIIANSSDIKSLIRNIHSSTGMSVSSSLDTNLSLKNISVPKQNLAKHETELLPSFDCLFEEDLEINLHKDITDFPLILPDDNSFRRNTSPSLEEHNYTSLKVNEDLEDVGVCLHVSKHRVSLEFCTKCSDKAQDSWSQL